MRWSPLFILLLMLCMIGCAQKRRMTISTVPPDATLKINGQPAVPAPTTHEFVFRGVEDRHTIIASRLGYKDQSVLITRDQARDVLQIQLQPETRTVSFEIKPLPAILKANGKPLNTSPVTALTTELPFTADAQGQWTTYTITAERAGFETAEQVIAFTDPNPLYRLQLDPMRKDLLITTEPAGAQVYLDEESLGESPVKVEDRAFAVNPETSEWISQTVKVVSPGYDPITASISWDNGQNSYHVDLKPKIKTVRIVTNPAAAVVTLDGRELPRDQDGASIVELSFPPIDAEGNLKTYTAVATRQTEESEWYPRTFTIGWEDGKENYDVAMKEILTLPVRLVVPEMQRRAGAWEVIAREIPTLGMKDVTEGANKPSPAQLTRLQKGAIFDSIAVSPDGSKLIFPLLIDNGTDDFRSQLIMIDTDGTGGETYMSDAKSLELTPSFTPAGDKILFASNRGGKNLSIWAVSTTGATGIEQYTTGESNDLWPTIDSDPRPRLFHQAHVNTRSDPRLYMNTLGTNIRTDLTYAGGSQPRVSPKNDTIVFVGLNEKTGKRDLFKISDKGGVPQNITNTPDIDEFDPAWNKDGSKLAFVSDRAKNDETGNNYDIWYVDFANPERPVQVTSNGSWDDRPAWDPNDSAIYFRSNRGGEWNVWRIPLR